MSAKEWGTNSCRHKTERAAETGEGRRKGINSSNYSTPKSWAVEPQFKRWNISCKEKTLVEKGEREG